MSRPVFNEAHAKKIATERFGIDVAKVSELGGYVDRNFALEARNGSKFVLKAHSLADEDAVIDLQVNVVEHLRNQGLRYELPLQHGKVVFDCDDEGNDVRFRLIDFLDGKLLADFGSLKSPLLNFAGAAAGSIDALLEGFQHSAASRRDLLWDLQNASQLVQFLPQISDPAVRRNANHFLLRYEMDAAPVLASLQRSICHNDCHRFALMSKDGNSISGVIDFGDTVLTYPICHLAISISDLLVGQNDLLSAAGNIAAGYHKQRPLAVDEIDILHCLVGTRLAIYLCMAARAANSDPDNSHAQMKKKDTEALIAKWVKINPVACAETIRTSCGQNSLTSDAPQRSSEQVSRREQYFSNSLYTHYDEPLFLAGGAFQYLFDHNGKNYLDLVNNVCQFGHCHPTIIRAAQKQIATLNTNSRYMYKQMPDYAERLLDSFPDGLDTVFFVNSGSEANDLAMRMARASTGNSNMVVVDTAYHGNSSVCTDISPNRIEGEGLPGLPGYVQKIPVPDRYRGPYGYDDAMAGSKYAKPLNAIIDDLRKHDKAIAAFYAESLIGTGGQIVLPPDYLKSVYKLVRDAGGMCIADEVQMGFGRTGEHMWCFESQSVVPDIVTMGKPMANGYPMGAVVTRREIADAFDNGVPYFNTFGGNPVACASAIAVLDVMETESLRGNCVEMSQRLRSGLADLAKKYAIIGEARGLGLYLGVELVRDRDSKEPAVNQARAVVETMKTKGFLTNTNGYLGNVLKFKPPLLITPEDIDRTVVALDESLASVSGV